ncbi:MAG: hypothetical protein FJ272_19145, partial [Planctomycetes bacterium]|nr:hypothetical protein [Planctomycetota bacterium]
WRAYTAVASGPSGVQNLKTVAAGAVRGAGYHAGWYGFWFLDDQERMGNAARQWELAGQAGVKRLLYYDLGEVGDYAGFFGADGKMRHNGWSIPFWKSDEPLTARWFGLQAFMQNASWSPWPTAKDYGLPPFTAPDGSAADDLYSVLSRRDLDGKWAFDHFSNARVTDEIAERSGLAGISQRQQGKADVQGKSGWVTSRLIHVDFGNPQLLDYQCREIARLIPKLRPDGIHADNFGDLHIARADVAGFGLWSVHGFREFLKRRFSQAELAGMGIADVDTFDPPQARLRGGFDIAAYVREKQMEPKGNKWMQLRSPKWTADPIWLRYLVYKVETGLGYHRRFYEAAKQAAAQAGVDCAVFGNLVPGAPGAALMKGFCDIAHFEWSTTRGWWGLREMALPPKGRVGYVARLGAAISDAGYCWPSLYVPKNLSGAGHENLHKVLALDCLANRGLLDFGHWFLDGYSPGTPESAGFVNRFIRRQAARLSRREYLADVAVVHSAWSEVASLTVFHPVTEMFIDEYSGWCQFLGDTHRQWDVVLAEDLSAARLARFPIVVLPSVMVLTDAQAAELSKYVEAGGRLVATGLTGTRYGPDKYLALRP